MNFISTDLLELEAALVGRAGFFGSGRKERTRPAAAVPNIAANLCPHAADVQITPVVLQSEMFGDVFDFLVETLLVAWVERKIAKILGVPGDVGEVVERVDVVDHLVLNFCDPLKKRPPKAEK